jgi:NTP pyrophosphatase (non-canonical NTP hydrolase)
MEECNMNQEIKRFEEYIRFTDSTAIYSKEHALDYTTMGLTGEMAEFVDHISHYGASDRSQNAKKEAGDIYWYFARLLKHIGLEYTIFADSYQKRLYNVRLGGNISSSSPSEFMVQCGKLCNKMKKIIRDDNGFVRSSKREVIADFLINLMVDFTVHLESVLDISFTEVLDLNQNKLTDRKSRGVIGGSGDNR